jgi:hypothetical protein
MILNEKDLEKIESVAYAILEKTTAPNVTKVLTSIVLSSGDETFVRIELVTSEYDEFLDYDAQVYEIGVDDFLNKTVKEICNETKYYTKEHAPRPKVRIRELERKMDYIGKLITHEYRLIDQINEAYSPKVVSSLGSQLYANVNEYQRIMLELKREYKELLKEK